MRKYLPGLVAIHVDTSYGGRRTIYARHNKLDDEELQEKVLQAIIQGDFIWAWGDNGDEEGPHDKLF